MSLSITKKLLHASAMALIVSAAAGSSLIVTADAAYAERGGNGNGNGGGNGGGKDRDRDNARGNGNGNGNGRGTIARELRGLNAANANQRALENASPNSMPGKLYAYQSEEIERRAAIDAAEAEEAAAQAEFDRLVGLTEDEVAAEFPDGGYEDAVTAAADDLQTAQGEAQAARDAVNESLIVLTDGRTLSSAALAELNRMLGL